MSEALVDLLRDRSRPMSPHPTNETPRITRLDGIRSVLFDVYGTLVTSGSGDVGTAEKSGRGSAFVEALAAVGLEYTGDGDKGVQRLVGTIRFHHSQTDVEYAEVDIVAVWQSLLETDDVRKHLAGIADEGLDEATRQRLAIEYETRVNPVWPMPGTGETLDALRAHGTTLGIVSNAQFFTPLLFPALLDHTLEDFGFADDLQYYSYRFLQAKPGTFLYERAAEGVAAHGLSPHEVLYVGNDLLNDVMPAAKVGFRTALFAGDGRSLRWRQGDARVEGVAPDLVVTELPQLLEAVGA